MKLITSFNTISGGVDSITIDNDERHLNWVAGTVGFGTPYGTFYTETFSKLDNGVEVIYEYYSDGITLKVERKNIGDKYRETYTFTNSDDKEVVELKADKIGIYAPFNDSYDIAEVSLNRRCHAHIWCGGNCTYIYGLRMNGEEGNVGLVLTKGYIESYGVERNNNSNDRGDFILYLNEMTLEPKESYVIEWEMFAFTDVRDFFDKASDYDPFINLQGKWFSCGIGETFTLTADRFIDKAFLDNEEIHAANTKVGAKILMSYKSVGEKKLELHYGKHKTFAYFNVYDSIINVIDRRINFIIKNQQIDDRSSKYYGAYVLYDNEENEPFVIGGRLSNYNAARERAGMTCLMISRLLKGVDDKKFKDKIFKSLMLSIDFIDREIVREDGTVCDDVGLKKAFAFLHRKYNYAWYANIYTLMYELTGEEKHINKAMLIIEKYYSIGGDKFYAIGMPIIRLIALAERDNLRNIGSRAKELFLNHGNTLLLMGDNIPTHEVKYEQSIVAPAATILLSCYNITDDKIYLEGAEVFLKYLNVMNGYQPDYHMRDISIRHWDGHWFGKSKMYGDTFPHHWSCLTAEVFSLYANISGNKSYVDRADNILRNNLCLFDEQGRGSAAFIYPKYVNGRKGNFYDPYANDQDWALYYMLEYSTEI